MNSTSESDPPPEYSSTQDSNNYSNPEGKGSQQMHEMEKAALEETPDVILYGQHSETFIHGALMRTLYHLASLDTVHDRGLFLSSNEVWKSLHDLDKTLSTQQKDVDRLYSATKWENRMKSNSWLQSLAKALAAAAGVPLFSGLTGTAMISYTVLMLASERFKTLPEEVQSTLTTSKNDIADATLWRLVHSSKDLPGTSTEADARSTAESIMLTSEMSRPRIETLLSILATPLELKVVKIKSVEKKTKKQSWGLWGWTGRIAGVVGGAVVGVLAAPVLIPAGAGAALTAAITAGTAGAAGAAGAGAGHGAGRLALDNDDTVVKEALTERAEEVVRQTSYIQVLVTLLLNLGVGTPEQLPSAFELEKMIFAAVIELPDVKECHITTPAEWPEYGTFKPTEVFPEKPHPTLDPSFDFRKSTDPQREMEAGWLRIELIIRTLRLRQAIVNTGYIGIVGSQGAGKSTFVSGFTDQHIQLRTMVPGMYPVSPGLVRESKAKRREVHVIDFPGANEVVDVAAQQYKIGRAAAGTLVIVISLDSPFSDVTVQVLRDVVALDQQKGSTLTRKVIVVINKCDVKPRWTKENWDEVKMKFMKACRTNPSFYIAGEVGPSEMLVKEENVLLCGDVFVNEDRVERAMEAAGVPEDSSAWKLLGEDGLHSKGFSWFYDQLVTIVDSEVADKVVSGLRKAQDRLGENGVMSPTQLRLHCVGLA